MSLLYFRPHQKDTPTTAQLTDWGVSYMSDGSVTSRGVANGPSGEPGCVFADGSADAAHVKYVEEKQTWMRVNDDVWAGMYTESPPHPEDLERANTLNQQTTVTLLDGNQWKVPVARQAIGDDGTPMLACVLPRRLGLDENRQVTQGDVVPQYKPLDELCDRWLEYWRSMAEEADEAGEESVTVDLTDMANYAVSALQVNYRIGLVEAFELLGLFSSPEIGAVLNAVTDMEELLRRSQKKAEASAG